MNKRYFLLWKNKISKELELIRLGIFLVQKGHASSRNIVNIIHNSILFIIFYFLGI